MKRQQQQQAQAHSKGRAKGALFLPWVHVEEHLAVEKEALASVLQRLWQVMKLSDSYKDADGFRVHL
jgi:hypothetical protein